MGIIGLTVCLAATYRLWSTPLWHVALATVAVQSVILVTRVAFGRAERILPRAVTGVGHVAVALGAFFLFASFQLR